jgi:hypothetical protein
MTVWTLPKPEPRVKRERTGKFYQQEFPVFEPRPLTELERMASAQRGFIRRARRAARHAK